MSGHVLSALQVRSNSLLIEVVFVYFVYIYIYEIYVYSIQYSILSILPRCSRLQKGSQENREVRDLGIAALCPDTQKHPTS